MAAGSHEDPGAPPIEPHQPVEAEIEAAAPGVPGDDDRGGDIGAGLDLGVPAGRECFEIDRLAAQYLVADGGCSSGQRADLTPYIDADADVAWDDISPFFRDFSASFGGSIYTIPLDGDFHMVYYRIDVLEELGMAPPTTWDEYLAIAEAANGMDMNGDGEGDYGSCISKARSQQSYWWITSIAAPFIQTQGTSEGAFFDPETFEPRVNNAGFIRALEIYAATGEFGPPDEQTINVGDTRSLFITGRCALSLDWGDIGSLAVDPEQSTVQDLVGAVVTPGSTEVVDFETGELVPCDEMHCPYAVDGVNYAPFASFGGWSGGISASVDQDTKDAAYAFFSYMAQPAQANVDVTIGRTGFNPYRTSQFEELGPWLESGMSESAAENYLGAIQDSLNSPNMVLDLRVPQNQRYQQVVLDTVASQFLAGEFTAEEAAEAITDQWNEITDELGREDQLAAYLGSLGVER
jgi:multiple sugar transport system substrate-binding protein